MTYLLDTHAFIWWLTNDPQLSRPAFQAVASGERDVFVSAASAWEITTKHRLGKLPEADRLAADVEGEALQERFIPLPVTMAEAELAGRLEGSHRDPFDRMLVAQALRGQRILISNERAFDAFGVSRLW